MVKGVQDWIKIADESYDDTRGAFDDEELNESALNSFELVPSNSEGAGDASQAAASAAALDNIIKKASTMTKSKIRSELKSSISTLLRACVEQASDAVKECARGQLRESFGQVCKEIEDKAAAAMHCVSKRLSLEDVAPEESHATARQEMAERAAPILQDIEEKLESLGSRVTPKVEICREQVDKAHDVLGKLDMALGAAEQVFAPDMFAALRTHGLVIGLAIEDLVKRVPEIKNELMQRVTEMGRDKFIAIVKVSIDQAGALQGMIQYVNDFLEGKATGLMSDSSDMVDLQGHVDIELLRAKEVKTILLGVNETMGQLSSEDIARISDDAFSEKYAHHHCSAVCNEDSQHGEPDVEPGPSPVPGQISTTSLTVSTQEKTQEHIDVAVASCINGVTKISGIIRQIDFGLLSDEDPNQFADAKAIAAGDERQELESLLSKAGASEEMDFFLELWHFAKHAVGVCRSVHQELTNIVEQADALVLQMESLVERNEMLVTELSSARQLLEKSDSDPVEVLRNVQTRVANFLPPAATTMLAKVEAITAGALERTIAVIDKELKRVADATLTGNTELLP